MVSLLETLDENCQRAAGHTFAMHSDKNYEFLKLWCWLKFKCTMLYRLYHCICVIHQCLWKDIFCLSVISRHVVVCNFPSAKSQQSNFIKMFQRERNPAIARVHNGKIITAAVQLNYKMGYILCKCSALLRVLFKK